MSSNSNTARRSKSFCFYAAFKGLLKFLLSPYSSEFLCKIQVFPTQILG
ncbi:MAG: hypothetical protein WBB26_01330 [Saprospiraceae bacterium]